MKLGSSQKWVLGTLCNSSHGTWHHNVGWTYGGHMATQHMMESLERRGLVEKFDHPRHAPAFRVTEFGRKVYEGKV